MNLSPQTWTAISKLLDEALDLDPERRGRWLDALTQREPQLAPAVRELLAAHADRETADLLATLPALAVSAAGAGGLAPGDRVGPYRLKRELGAGGMAEVWLAERADGAFARDVALKIPQQSRLRRDLAGRFARERDILARLEHPHIARLYDAGVSADGLPYLALEYVEGQPINAYCDERRLEVPARLRLFAQVLDAVQYAHARLVIHRDLKPSNILVNAEGQVRLLDFGIAKLLADDERAPATQLTQLAGRALTPDYASPEQIKGEPLTIATDVYSLGVVLYELLCGSRPYRLRLSSPAQLEQAIVEADPARPGGAIESDAAAQARGTTRRRLAQALAGDLDTIALKALRKVPAQRYGTAAALAEDLQRYRAGRAVLARPDAFWYRVGKTLARHKLAAVAVGAALLALLGGGAVALWQASVARTQAERATREALHAQTVQRFLLDIFKANSDQQPDPVKARATTARELLDIGARRAAARLKNVPEVEDEVLGTLADMYVQLKLAEPAVALRRQRVAALRRAYGADDPRVAAALVSLATDLADTDQRGELPQVLDEAERILDAAGDRTSPTRAALLVERANYFRYGSLAQMRIDADRAVALYRARYPDNGALVHALRLAALARLYAGDPLAAEPLFRELVETSRRLYPDAPVWLTTPLVHLAETQIVLVKVDEAVANFRRALEITRQVNGEFNADALQTQAKLGGYLHATGRRAEGRALLFDALHALGREPGNDAPNTVGTIDLQLGLALGAEGRIEEARKYIDAEVDDLRRHYPQSQPLARTLIVQADLATAAGRYREARALLDEADAMWNAVARDLPAFTANPARFARARLLLAQDRADDALAVLAAVRLPPYGDKVPLAIDAVTTGLLQARAHLEAGRVDAARAAARRALEAVQRSPVRAYFETLEADAALTLGQALGCRGGGGRDDLEHAYRLRLRLDDPDSLALAQTRIALANCLLDQGQRAPAAALLSAAQRAYRVHAPAAGHDRDALSELQRRFARPATAS